MTGVANPVSGQVVYAGTGATAADFPADSAGKIVLLDQGADAAARNTQVANAVAAGAVGIILGTTTGAAGIPAAPPTSRSPRPQPTSRHWAPAARTWTGSRRCWPPAR